MQCIHSVNHISHSVTIHIFHTLLLVSFCYLSYLSLFYLESSLQWEMLHIIIKTEKKGKQNQKQKYSINRKSENSTVAIYHNHE